MARYDILEIPNCESGTQVDFRAGSGTDSGIRRFTIVVATPQFETCDTVRYFSGLPFVGQANSKNTNQICTGIKVTQKSPVLYEAEVTYSLDLGASGGSKGGSKKPTQQPPVISVSSVAYQEAIDEQADGLGPIMTATAEQLSPPIQRQFGDLVLTVETNVPTFNPLTARKWLFKVNSDPFLGVPAGQALCTNIGADQVFDADGSSYYRKKSSVQFREQGRMSSPDRAWWWRQLAQGYQWFIYRSGNGSLVSPYQAGGSTTGGSAKPSLVKAWNSYGDVGSPQLHDPDNGGPFWLPFSIPDPVKGSVIDWSPKRAKFYEFKIYPSIAFAGGPLL